MPELRKDPVTGRWTIFAPERARPMATAPGPGPDHPASHDGAGCPFCPGQEERTPPEILAHRPAGAVANGPDWTVRVVPNKFPALRVEGNLDKTGEGLYDRMNGIGAHEVIIETPQHDRGVADRAPAELVGVFEAYKSRLLDLRRDIRFKYVLLFKNSGPRAGALLAHPHSQLLATPVLPLRVREELNGARAYYSYRDRCVFCDVIHQERQQRTRFVAETAHFLAVCPYAAPFPFECRVYPRRHCADFHEATGDELLDLADIVISVTAKLAAGLGDPAYTWVLHTAPIRWPHMGYWRTIDDDYHWHLTITPKLDMPATLEWGAGYYINPTLPETAAAFLRETPHG